MSEELSYVPLTDNEITFQASVRVVKELKEMILPASRVQSIDATIAEMQRQCDHRPVRELNVSVDQGKTLVVNWKGKCPICEYEYLPPDMAKMLAHQYKQA